SVEVVQASGSWPLVLERRHMPISSAGAPVELAHAERMETQTLARTSPARPRWPAHRTWATLIPPLGPPSIRIPRPRWTFAIYRETIADVSLDRLHHAAPQCFACRIDRRVR